jgi:Ser/Thr protein kinase RdoA (MazF antagonist)
MRMTDKTSENDLSGQIRNSRSVFDDLTPDFILGAVESSGFMPTGEITQLNSYENRVFDIKVEPHDLIGTAAGPRPGVIAKFYRPGRWSIAAIQDEHDFLNDLKAEGIPAVAPFSTRNQNNGKDETIFQYEGFPTALFPKTAGRMPQEFLTGELETVGRLLARLHNVGARRRSSHRLTLDAETYGYHALDRLERVVYPEMWNRYRDACEAILEYLDDELDPRENIRIHGDCHKGNLLQVDSVSPTGAKEGGFFFVDFDDSCNGPPVQDFFMLLSGASDLDDQAKRELDSLLSGYEELREVPDNLYLLEALRGLRILHYSGWIAARWEDPFFPRLFPDFDTYNWWASECLRIEQIAAGL